MRRCFKVILYAVFSLSLVIVIFLCLEIYTLFNLYLVDKNNKFVIDRQEIDGIYRKAFGSSLWERPWQEYKKNVKAEAKVEGKFTHRIEINSLGLRTKEIELPKPKGIYRIICIGGSTTFEGINNNKTYPSLVERKLNNYFATEKIEVLNCGISGLSSDDEKNRMGFYLELEPDLIIDYSAVNDIFWKLLPWYESNMPRWKRLIAGSEFLSRFLRRHLLPTKEQIRRYLRDFSMVNIVAMHNEARKHNAVFWECSFARPEPPKLCREEVEYLEYTIRRTRRNRYLDFAAYCEIIDIYNELLKDTALRNNIPFIPVAENLKGNTEYFLDICHLYPPGIWRKANIIFIFLKDYLIKNS